MSKREPKNSGKKSKGRSSKRPKIKTVAENQSKSDSDGPQSLADKLSKPFSLVTCKRLVALVEQHNRDASSLEGLKDSRKSVIELLKQPNIEPSRERDLALQKYRTENDIALRRVSLKAGHTDAFRLIMEACGGTLFEAAEAEEADRERDEDVTGQTTFNGMNVAGSSSSAPLASRLGITGKPTLALPPGRADAKVLDDRGQEVAAFCECGSVVDDGLCSTWWAWYRAGVRAWTGKDETKVGAMIRRLHALASPIQTPAQYLCAMREWFRAAKTRREAIDSLPDLIGWFSDGISEILLACSTGKNRDDLGHLLGQISKANVDAFVEWSGGKDSALNKIRIEYEV